MENKKPMTSGRNRNLGATVALEEWMTWYDKRNVWERSEW